MWHIQCMSCSTLAKFKVAKASGLEGDGFTRKYTFWHLTLTPRLMSHQTSTSCDLCNCKVWNCYRQWFRRRYNYKELDGRTNECTHARTHTRTDGLTHENVLVFKKKSSQLGKKTYTIQTYGINLILTLLTPYIGSTNVLIVVSIWASAWDFQQCGMCDQQSLSPACAYAVWSEPLVVARISYEY